SRGSTPAVDTADDTTIPTGNARVQPVNHAGANAELAVEGQLQDACVIAPAVSATNGTHEPIGDANTQTANPINVNTNDNVKQNKGPDGGGPLGDPDVVKDMKAKVTASKSSSLWDTYIKITEEEDKDILEEWEGGIDVTLVFAALFSAISTGSKNLKPENTDDTVAAIRELTSVLQLAFQQNLGPTQMREASIPSVNSSKPSTLIIWVNCLWFLSLGLSIFVSLFAMLAKGWCYRSRSRHFGTPYERAMKRQKAWGALEQWKMELLIEQLSTLMHVALIDEVLDYVSNFPEVILDSRASSDQLLDATTRIMGHIQRLQHDAIEYHEVNTPKFSAGCGRFIYLTVRSWLHSGPLARELRGRRYYQMMRDHTPLMTAEEFQNQLTAATKQKFPSAGSVLWLERLAVKMVLGCLPENSFTMCKALCEVILAKESDEYTLQEEIHLALWWIFLNSILDCGKFWPTPVNNDNTLGSTELRHDGAISILDTDSTLTLNYFRHALTRQNNSNWLKVVGITGMLYMFTNDNFHDHSSSPQIETNETYFDTLISLLTDALGPYSDPDAFTGTLPVYCKNEVLLCEFDAL
ncbi:hypothetical protein FRC11_009754, partial [Ceratobasidium sp. 423]